MKRILFTITAIAVFISCGAQNQKARVFPNGVKISGDPIITTVPGTSHLMVLDQDGYSGRISLANLISQMNIVTGNLTQEEVEDIIGNALVGGSHSGATFTYNDNGTGTGTIDIDITGGSISLDATIIDGSTNGVEGNAIYDRFVRAVDEALTSPEEIIFWKGTKAQLYSEYGNPPVGLQDWIYQVTDSIPATPPGGGDMEALNYDADLNFIVDNAQNLNGQPPSYYETQRTDEEIRDVIGATLTGNSENGITVTPQDPTDKIDFVVSVGTSNIQDGAVMKAKVGSDFYNQTPFTPTLFDTGGGATYNLDTATGTWTVFGDWIMLEIYIDVASTSGTPTGDLRIGGLPFATPGGFPLMLSFIGIDSAYSDGIHLATVNSDPGVLRFNYRNPSSNPHNNRSTVPADTFGTNVNFLITGMFPNN